MAASEWVGKRGARFAGTLAASALLAGSSAASISGVCPDGSIYIVQRAESIPCRDSKQVRPEEIPPLKPEMLPRPYGWEVFNRRNDPNNPYNLVDTGRAVRGGAAAEPVGPAPQPSEAPEPATAQPSVVASRNGSAPPVSSPPPGAAAADALQLALAHDEVRDLGLIVEYSQRRAPATLTRGGTPEEPSLVLRLAESRSFEARLRDAARRSGVELSGPVVLFSARSAGHDAFYANLTFVQDHIAFHPDAARSDEIGVIDGRLGPLGADGQVLGYVVLPAQMDLAQPIDIYWDDHQLTATLRP